MIIVCMMKSMTFALMLIVRFAKLLSCSVSVDVDLTTKSFGDEIP